MKNKIIVGSAKINDPEYSAWFETLKNRYRSSQIKAVVKINTELLEFYWSLGRDIAEKKAEERWGSGVIERLSSDFKSAFPGQKGFSTTNLWYIKKWFLFYSHDLEKLHQLGGEFFCVPWRHHIEIITKCRDAGEAFFYIRKTVENNLSRSALQDILSLKLHETSGKALTNFKNTLGEIQGNLAHEMLKDPYKFDFLTMHPGYDEEALEDSLIHEITKLLLELGKGFAFVGRQVELVVSGTSYHIDMLFYHIHLKCYVVVELKVVPFKPEFIGKLNFYVTAVDKLLKRNDDNPTIGLLICKSKDNTKVEWSFEGLQKPLGVAVYDINISDIKSALPTNEEIENGLDKPASF
ncbi:DUF1016 family protein [bacterium]|nr:DUF1016 family protein [bacterium]